MSDWMYNEFKHCGVDYSQADQAKVYDDRHQRFRDYEKEFKGMIDFLELENTQDLTLVDLGCGTGATAIFAAACFKTVYAVDVSPVMIERAQSKLGKSLQNLIFVNAGFLTYRPEHDPVDLVITKAAFHHLPDFWKQVALLNINRMLKPDGILYIHDVVFQFSPEEFDTRIDRWIEGFEQVAGKEFSREVYTHIRDEYSTFGWIMNGLLENAGFSVDKCRSNDDFVTEYACRKIRDVHA